MEIKEKLLDFFRKKDRFGAHNKIEVIDVKPGWAKVQVRIGEKHLNGVDIAHGGVIFTLADIAMGLAANSHGRAAVTLGADISFFSPVEKGMLLVAEAEELALRRTIGSYLISVKAEDGTLVATMKCQAYRKGEIAFSDV